MRFQYIFERILWRQEISKLRRSCLQSERIIEMLAVDGQSDLIIHKLRQDEQLEDIYKQLIENSSNDRSVGSRGSSQWSCESSRSDRGDDERQTSPCLGEALVDSFKNGSRWTNIPLSDSVIEQVLLLYFCWEYPNGLGLDK